MNDEYFKSETLDYYKRLESLILFTKVGNYPGNEFIRVTSWNDAVKQFETIDTENSQIGSANEISNDFTLEMRRERDRNEINRKVKPKTLSLIEAKMLEAVQSGRISQFHMEAIKDGIRWDFLHFAIKCEYADWVSPGFLDKKIDLYFEGFFPCGWIGEYPEGRMVIF